MRETDMLVKLYDLPENHVPDEKMSAAGIRVFRPMALDRKRISDFIREQFGEGWATEFERTMSNQPISCFIAVNREKKIVGFACYDATARGFFGPIGVEESCRGLHVGKELLLTALYDMRNVGYGYAAIGWVGEHNLKFYAQNAGATEIPDSFPGVYRNSLIVKD